MADRSEDVESCPSITINLYPLPQCLWPPNLAEWWLNMTDSHPKNHMAVLLRGLARSRNILKTLYLHYYSAYGHQYWYGGDLSWGYPNREVEWRFGHVVWQGHVTNKNHYISTTRVPVATKHGRMVTYPDWLLTIKSLGALIKWSCEVTRQMKTIICPTIISPMTTKLGRMIACLDGIHL